MSTARPDIGGSKSLVFDDTIARSLERYQWRSVVLFRILSDVTISGIIAEPVFAQRDRALRHGAVLRNYSLGKSD